MITSHLYPTDDTAPQTRTGFTDAVKKAASVATARGVPLVVTEYNTGLGLPQVQFGTVLRTWKHMIHCD